MSPYDEWSAFYDGLVRSKNLLLELCFDIELSFDLALDLLGDLAGRNVCDLGCGQGKLARRMAQRGASVTAVDASEGMLKLPKSHSWPPGVRYLTTTRRIPACCHPGRSTPSSPTSC